MGQGLPWPAPGIVPWANMFALPPWTGDESSATMARHWYFDGLQAPDATEIPYAWLGGTVRARQVKPFTYAAVTKRNGPTAIAQVSADEQVEYVAELDCDDEVSAPNLAHFVITYYDAPAMRLPQLQLVLNRRTEEEIWIILGVGLGTRITITDAPTGWPQGADSLVVEGIRHVSRGDGAGRLVEWSTAPLVGEEPGQVGPFARVGVSQLDGDDKLPW